MDFLKNRPQAYHYDFASGLVPKTASMPSEGLDHKLQSVRGCVVLQISITHLELLYK